MTRRARQTSRLNSSVAAVELTYHGRIPVPISRILALLLKGGIVIGQQQVAKADHTKRDSLDYWLREFGESPDTKQGDKKFIDKLFERAPGLFKRTKVNCPATGRRCKAIELTEEGRRRAETEKRRR